ncbi:alpha-ribazole-5-phosphate synthase [Clostridium niameyense]|uniref:alpha-ribazole-5-phosphate synthase n=1 Tax=Clostridium niameyense TaxID=1622073 RepID=UPI00067ED172|nr:alpha-ribazole-5-phosphate synthase [Clostridium niameyense]
MNIKKIRDLTLIKLDESKTMVIACDSCGSIGMKQYDVLKIPAFYTGKFTARVGIMEVISTGAEVVTITNAVCCEMNPTGLEIINGIKEELKQADISDIVLTGSTEENFPTYSTGVGMSVIGIADNSKIKINNIKKPCVVVSIGLPKVGSEIDLKNDNEIIDYKSIKKFYENKLIYEIVPVGSKGILYEAQLLANNNNLLFQLDNKDEKFIKKSAGPSTVIIAALDEKELKNLRKNVKNITVIGHMRSNNYS